MGNLIDISEDFSGNFSYHSSTFNEADYSFLKVGPPPPLPSRNSVASNAISDPFATAINFDQALPPPSSETEKWWDRRIDETWIPRLGDERNPFYTF